MTTKTLETITRMLVSATALIILSTVQNASAATIDDAIAAYLRGDYETAVVHFRVEAEQGNAEAQANLGVMFDFGQGVPEDDAEAVRW